MCFFLKNVSVIFAPAAVQHVCCLNSSLQMAACLFNVLIHPNAE